MHSKECPSPIHNCSRHPVAPWSISALLTCNTEGDVDLG